MFLYDIFIICNYVLRLTASYVIQYFVFDLIIYMAFLHKNKPKNNVCLGFLDRPMKMESIKKPTVATLFLHYELSYCPFLGENDMFTKFGLFKEEN